MSEPIVIDTGVDAVYCDELQRPAPYYAKAYPVESRPGCWNTNRVVIIDRETEQEIGEYEYGYSSPHRTFHPFKLRGTWYALYSRDYTATRIMSLPDCKDLGGEEGSGGGFCPVDYWVPPLDYIDVQHFDDCPRNEKDGRKPDYKQSCSCQFKHKDGCPIGVPNPKVVKGRYEWDKCICKEEMRAFDRWHMPYVFPDRVHGFIAGCHWGDDGSWKIQYLDLSRADEGIIKREERFGYIGKPGKLNLSQAIHLTVDGDDSWLEIDITKHFDLLKGDVKE